MMVSDQQNADTSDSSKESNSQTINDNNSRASLDHQGTAKTTTCVPSTNDTEKSTDALSNGNSDIPQLDERLKASDESESIVTTINLNESKIESPSISCSNHKVIVNNNSENTKKRNADICVSLNDSSDEDGSNKSNERVVKKAKTCLAKSLTNGTSKKSNITAADCDSGSDNSLEIDEPEEIEIDSGDEDGKQSSKNVSIMKLTNNIDEPKDSIAETNNSGTELSCESGLSSDTSSADQNTYNKKLNSHSESSYPELKMECTSETLSEYQKNVFNLLSADFKNILDILQSYPQMVSRNIVALIYMNIFIGIWLYIKCYVCY